MIPISCYRQRPASNFSQRQDLPCTVGDDDYTMHSPEGINLTRNLQVLDFCYGRVKRIVGSGWGVGVEVTKARAGALI